MGERPIAELQFADFISCAFDPIVTVGAYGAMVDLALRAAEELAAEASVELLDLRTVWPLDSDAILASLARTSRACVLQEASSSLGAAGQVLSLIAREV